MGNCVGCIREPEAYIEVTLNTVEVEQDPYSNAELATQNQRVVRQYQDGSTQERNIRRQVYAQNGFNNPGPQYLLR